MTRPDWIITSYEEPPIPVPGFWRAYDDRLGAGCETARICAIWRGAA